MTFKEQAARESKQATDFRDIHTKNRICQGIANARETDEHRYWFKTPEAENIFSMTAIAHDSELLLARCSSLPCCDGSPGVRTPLIDCLGCESPDYHAIVDALTEQYNVPVAETKRSLQEDFYSSGTVNGRWEFIMRTL